jgi:hypothetical protein
MRIAASSVSWDEDEEDEEDEEGAKGGQGTAKTTAAGNS